MTQTPPSLDDRVTNLEAIVAEHERNLDALAANFDKAIVAIKTKLDRQTNSSYQK